jgi:hypothetical protein
VILPKAMRREAAAASRTHNLDCLLHVQRAGVPKYIPALAYLYDLDYCALRGHRPMGVRVAPETQRGLLANGRDWRMAEGMSGLLVPRGVESME